MAKTFNKIGIIGRVKNAGVKETLKTLIDYLAQLNKKIIIETETAEVLDIGSLKTVPREQLANESDLVIVVGGDGSLLSASHTLFNQGVPVLGINRGSLGFLTDIHPKELTKIKAILEGDFILEDRFLLTASIELQGQKIIPEARSANALNEFALIPNVVPHMIEFEIYIDQKLVCSQRSDGLIIATPTGSTAYALSAGGPIINPQLDAIVIIPMFPHTLSIRPLVVAANQEIKIVVTPHNSETPRLSADGQNYTNTPPGSQITITKNPKQLHLVHPLDYDYYETLRSKLHWGRKLQLTE